MSTRAAIIYHTGSEYLGIYCHNSGYLHGVGRTLNEHYGDAGKVAALIELGDVSSLGERVEPEGDPNAHSFDAPEPGTTVAYYRDRFCKCEEKGGWEPEDRLPMRGKSVKAVTKMMDHDGYVYVFKDRDWSVNGERLADVLGGLELITSDARRSMGEVNAAVQAVEVRAGAARRLIAPDLDLTRDAFDQTAGELPLLAFCF